MRPLHPFGIALAAVPLLALASLSVPDAAPEAAPAASRPAPPTRALRLGDREFYSKGPFVAFAAPWCADRARALVVGRDLNDSIAFDPATFPAGTVIRSQAPGVDPGVHGCGVYGYHHVAYGNYNDGIPEQAVPPRQVRAIRTLAVDLDVAFAGEGEFNVLQEFFLTAQPGSHRRQLIEIGYLLHPSASARKFAQSGRRYGDYTDPAGRTWHLYRVARYLMLVPAAGDVSAGALDIAHLLKELTKRRLLKGSEWFNGMAIGIEPVMGDSEMTIRKWRIHYR